MYYEQIAMLANKQECTTNIDTMRSAIIRSRLANERLYVETKNRCDQVTDDVIADDTRSRAAWNAALSDAKMKTEELDRAEQSVVACLN